MLVTITVSGNEASDDFSIVQTLCKTIKPANLDASMEEDRIHVESEER